MRPAFAPVAEVLEAALALRAEGRPEEALQLLASPEEFSQDIFTLRGDIQRDLGQLDEAVTSYSTIIDFAGDCVYSQFQLALCLRRLERWEAAADAFRKLLIHDSHKDSARIGLGECLLRLNRAQEALGCFNACWMESAQQKALFGKAVCLQLLRRFEEAISAYQRLIELDPKCEEAYSNLIALHVERFDLIGVQRYSRHLLEIRPRSRVALQGLILTAVDRAEFEAAGRYYARLVKEADDEEPLQTAGCAKPVKYVLSAQAVGHLTEGCTNSIQAGSGQPVQTRQA